LIGLVRYVQLPRTLALLSLSLLLRLDRARGVFVSGDFAAESLHARRRRSVGPFVYHY